MTQPFPFPTRYHREVVSPGAIHPVHYYQATDPALDPANNVQPAKLWLKTDNTAAPTWFEEYFRNFNNTAWILHRAWVNDTFSVGEIPVADANGRLAPGTAGAPGNHASTHYEGAGDEVDIVQLGGFPGGTTTFLRADGTFAAPPGGGGLTQAYVGYNTIGGSQENVTGLRVYMKSITLANDCLLTAIEAHVDFGNGTDNVDSLGAALFTDNAGNPHRCLGYIDSPATSLLLDDTAGAGGGATGRWFSLAMGRWLAAGTYWIAVYSLETVASLRLYYDGSGSDKYYDSAGAWITDAGFYTVNSTTNRYSIRANTIR